MKVFKIFIIALLSVLLCGVLYLIISTGRPGEAAKTAIENAVTEVKDKAAEAAAKPLEPVLEDQLTQSLKDAGIPEEVTNEVLDSISQEDKEKLTAVVIKNTDKLEQAAEYIQNSDALGLTEYLQDSLNGTDLETMQGLLDKYGSTLIPDGIVPDLSDLPAIPAAPAE